MEKFASSRIEDPEFINSFRIELSKRLNEIENAPAIVEQRRINQLHDNSHLDYEKVLNGEKIKLESHRYDIFTELAYDSAFRLSVEEARQIKNLLFLPYKSFKNEDGE